MEAGGPPCSLLFPCQPCSIYWQEERGASEIHPPGCSCSCGFPRPGSLHGLLSSARKDQGWEEQRANIAFSLITGLGAALPGASLCFGLQHVIKVTKEHIKYCAHAACLPFHLPIEKLILLLTCGQSNPVKMPCKFLPRAECYRRWGGTAAPAPVPASAQETKVQQQKVSMGIISTWAHGLMISTVQVYSFYTHFSLAH